METARPLTSFSSGSGWGHAELYGLVIGPQFLSAFNQGLQLGSLLEEGSL